MRLHEALKRARKEQGLTQAQLAVDSALSIPTIRLLECGGGNLRSFWTALEHTGRELRGRNLPPGVNLGEQIMLLRKRRELSQRSLSAMVGTTQPTIIKLERENTGRLRVLEVVLRVLGAGPYLARIGSKASFYATAAASSGYHGWNTPTALLESLYSVFGKFDLDPCSPSKNPRLAPVWAKVRFTPEDDGLALPWHGRVFLNPPYGREIGRWTNKARTEVESENAQTVVAVLPARTDTNWWHNDVASCAEVLFLRGRLSFGDSGQCAPFPSAIAVWGATPEVLTMLKTALPESWRPGPPTSREETAH